MVEPSKYSELYTDSIEVLENYGQISAACSYAFHIHRFKPDNVKKLVKYKEALESAKNAIKDQLETIEKAFNTLETNIIIYFHNHKRTQEELLTLAEQQEQEIKKMETQEDKPNCTEVINMWEKAEKEAESIIKQDNSVEFKEEMDKVADYLDKLGY